MSIIKRQSENFYTRATVDTETIVDTESEKSFWAVAATDNPVRRNGWDETFNEILSVIPENMRLSRLDEGAVPLLNNHRQYDGVEGQLGTIIDYKIESNQLKVKILFSTQERWAGVWKDIKAKVVRSISAGYNVYKYVREVVEDSLPIYRAIDWEPMEISLAPVPADFKSKVRAEDNTGHEITIENFSPVQNRNSNMKTENTVVEQGTTETTQTRSEVSQPAQATVVTVNAEQVRAQAIAEERLRATEITSAVRSARLDESVATDLISRGVDINAARAEIINKIAESNKTPEVRNIQTSITVDEVDNTRNAMSDAIMHRAEPGSIKLEGKAHDFKYLTLLDVARHALEQSGVNSKSMSPNEVVKRAISTTDYPNLLNSTVERSIRKTYNAIPAEWKFLAKQKSAKDFRAITGVAVDGKTTFEEIAEGGEYKHSVLITDDSAQLKLKTFGRMIKITRQSIINDDLNVFGKLPQIIATAAADFQADKVWNLLINNAKTPDGKAIFHADHNNLAAGAVISETSLAAMRTKMYRQATPTGATMGIAPKFLIVPIELQTQAEKIMSSLLASANNDVNTMKGAYQIITNPRLLNATAWYLAADPSSLEGLVYAYLEGEEGLYTEKEVSFNDDSVTTKARLDFDCAAWDYRGFAKNPGA